MKNTTATAKRGFGRRALAVSLTAALAVTAFAGLGAVSSPVSAASDSYELVENIQDGVILHCFDWKYTDIIESLEDIASAGFTSIQTSPVQPAVSTGPWYWLYQPLSFSVAENGDLGTADELKELCAAAERYGIKVIVDVVANHLAGDHTAIEQDLSDDKYWHNLGEITSYSDRKQVTDGDLGMKDLATENEYVQQVVSNYISELKAMGVDGIRWDAAKHISLPSEGSNFWNMVSESGLYNYGEILDSPVNSDNSDVLMKEYTEYISVTDNTYSDSVTRAFKSGKAPAFDGNWTDEDIPANKLVYWGESHDTYSNGEHNGSNDYAQNIVDRGYAVAAAREGASALYFSRPYAAAKDSIRIGVKGSMHFTSPEIAAVNHFHNAMVGLEDAYGVTDNVSVVTRKNGGAVIVCGSGCGDVSVENVNGFVPAGTYFDEVTGNEFVVTESTITGTVGESGIAVVYDSDFVSKVYADKPSDTEFTGTLSVTLSAIKVNDASYSVIVDGENRIYDSGSFVDGDVITIGNEIPGDSKVFLNLTATPDSDASGSLSTTYTYYKLPERQLPTLDAGGVVLDNTKSDWSTVNVYVYDESGATTITNATWPGVKMTDCGDNYFSYELPDQFAECSHIMVIFNNGAGDQIPGAMQDGLTMAYTDKKLYNGTKWVDFESAEPVDDPVVDPDEPDPNDVYNLGLIGSFNDWNADIKMNYLKDWAVPGIYVATVDGLEPGDYEFKVRADGAWTMSWGEYEAEYDRTQNSQINCKATIKTQGERLVVLINTMEISEEAKKNPDSLVNDSSFSSDEIIEYWPVQYYVFTPDNSGRTYGVVGSFNNWSNDVPLEDKYGIGIYYGTVKDLPAGEYEYKVRADGAWAMSWGAYEAEYDRTQNSQINCTVSVTEDHSDRHSDNIPF